MSNMTGTQRNQFERYDLQETRPQFTRLTERGNRILSALTLLFVGLLGVLTYAAVQIFDGWHHFIVLGDIALVILAVAAWINSTRPAPEAQADTPFIPAGLRPKK
ncbi:MAG: hypothetical protein M3355_00910 [Actinomycetota bacterium]|nr:hypothetical protein [Actinomycetota bacterium]